ncbi:histidine kinase [Kitasatospora sp. MMS16-BH015]|uniref:SpoIIE family protein phosphatase n=1 Tax=Kitasatospora sp. MMS16-BH015 TaxID=2018025 RepID=UPI000CA3DED5|nr:SpoIIE family protein phosphatase [Kitasatospora sp. MMS16-BH015]AUG80417.1 histidine kinase [Kitasatospora sp. MMS16-BH015]
MTGVRSLLSVHSLAGRLFLGELVVVLLLVAAAVAAMVLQARSSADAEARRVTSSVAESFAHAPGTVAALESADPTAALQPQAERVRMTTGVDSVVVFDTSFVQLTSPYPDYLGRPYSPPAEVAQKVLPELRSGRSVTFDLSDHGYRSVATAVPVFGPDGHSKGVVAVNITVGKVNSVVTSHLPVLIGGTAAAVALAAIATALAARRLLRQTHGLGPTELARMYDHHNAVLHAVREGVLIVSDDGRLLLANDEARRLLDLPPDAEQRPVVDLGLDPATTALLTGESGASVGGEVTDVIHRAGDRLLAVNKRPTAPYGGLPGSVVTLRDSTELHELSTRMAAAGQRSRLLHEAGMRIGRTLDMTRTCEELAEVAVDGFADTVAVDLLDEVTQGEDPERAGRRLRRTAVRGAEDPRVAPVGSEVTARDGAAQGGSLTTARAVLAEDGAAVVAPLLVRGLVLGLVEFRRGAGREPFDQDDLVLAEELAARAAVSIDNARRFTREHGLAVALQHSLLPRSLPERTGLEVAYRYLPAHAGVGGDWFDVIGLPGFRTALVVGDVVGHGISAAVAMGRLRTTIRNFSALDLPPEEVLGRLDELVAQLDEEVAGLEIAGSTCVYAVYDPVSGSCVLAGAGHLRPALISPDGTVTYPELPVSPPLGVGGHPFETTELHLPTGSRLVLFTDGLVETRDTDIDVGLTRLRGALAAHADRTPEEICEAVTRTVLVGHPADDVALLVARTSLLAADRVAEWEVPMDPAAVAPVRTACAHQVARWGLEELGFATELILSELITNAIRYGAPPVRVRLLYDTTLVCEVTDASSTAPHLRWAATTDEGGRGIFLVAQLTHRWGTRYTPQGKVIWCEQLPPETPGTPDRPVGLAGLEDLGPVP